MNKCEFCEKLKKDYINETSKVIALLELTQCLIKDQLDQIKKLQNNQNKEVV